MSRKAKFCLPVLNVLLIVYCFCYSSCRCRLNFVHRHTWNMGWNYHWIVPAEPQPTIQPFPYFPLHVEGNPEYNAAMDQYVREYKAIERERFLLAIAFFP